MYPVCTLSNAVGLKLIKYLFVRQEPRNTLLARLPTFTISASSASKSFAACLAYRDLTYSIIHQQTMLEEADAIRVTITTRGFEHNPVFLKSRTLKACSPVAKILSLSIMVNITNKHRFPSPTSSEAHTEHDSPAQYFAGIMIIDTGTEALPAAGAIFPILGLRHEEIPCLSSTYLLDVLSSNITQ